MNAQGELETIKNPGPTLSSGKPGKAIEVPRRELLGWRKDPTGVINGGKPYVARLSSESGVPAVRKPSPTAELAALPPDERYAQLRRLLMENRGATAAETVQNVMTVLRVEDDATVYKLLADKELPPPRLRPRDFTLKGEEMISRLRFWPVIEAAAGDPHRLRAQLADASAEQLINLLRRYVSAAAELRDLPEFMDHAAPGEADELARSIVNKGRDAWAAAQQDPSQLPREPPPGYPDYSVVIDDIYQNRFGTDTPLAEPDPAKDPSVVYSPEWEDTLWQLIDKLNRGVPLEDALDGYTRSDLARLALAFDHARSRLQRRFEPLYGDDPDDFEWPMWSHWVISQGKQRYDEYLEHPETVRPSDPDDFDDWLFELMDEYERRYEAPLPQRKPLYGRRQDVLRLIRDRQGQATRSQLAKALPANYDIAELLDDLRVRGWAEPISNAGGEEPWTITPAGQSQLSD